MKKLVTICLTVIVFAFANSIVKAEVLETVNVDSKSASPTVSTTVLEQGKQYVIEVEDFYGYDTKGSKADAEWSYDINRATWIQHYGILNGQDALDLIVNGTSYDWMGTPDEIVSNDSVFTPHVYSPSHIYRLCFTGEGAPVSLQVYDGDPGPRYSDNNGILDVRIIQGPCCRIGEVVETALIPSGEFEMGRHVGDGFSEELPLHAVYLDSFYMSKYEITNQQYADFLNSAYPGQIKVDGGVVYASSDSSNSYPYCNTHSYDAESQIDYSGGVFSVMTKPEVGGRDMSNDPMVDVSWYGADAYCDYYGYRLPTEAEWEYAARGGEHSPYYRFPWGDTISHSQANYYSEGKYPYNVNPTISYHPCWDDGIEPYTSPVCSFAPNGYGLYDMAGNAWEWCNDWYRVQLTTI
jgi:formylglycine-generating enzyme required for sulfatase activity